MNFDLGTDQQEIKNRTTRFAEEEVAPRATELDRDDLVPLETLKKMADAGFMGLCVPEEYSGAGMDFIAGVDAGLEGRGWSERPDEFLGRPRAVQPVRDDSALAW